MGHLDDAMMTRVNEAISVSFGLGQTAAPAGEYSVGPVVTA